MPALFDPGYTTVASAVPDRLIAGEFPRVRKTVTFAQNATKYVRGHALGKITSSSKYTIALTASSDGSQVIEAVCVDEVDATAGDVVGAVWLTGEFNELVMTFGTGHSAASARDALRAKSIFLHTNLQP